MVLSALLQDTTTTTGMSGLEALITGCAGLVPTMLAYGCPIRGGIALGFGSSDFIEGEVLSSAQVTAYKLEKEAGYPRILLSDDLVGFLHDHAASPDPAEEYKRRMAHAALSSIDTDLDGKPFLNFLSGPLRKRLAGADYDWLLNKAYVFVAKEAAKWRRRRKDHPDDALAVKLAPRYDLLLGHFERSDLPSPGDRV